MLKLRRLLIIGILTFVLISACRGNAPQQTSSQANNTSTQAFRVINHALGEIKVPLDPQRVVVLSDGLDTVLSLGVKPVGSIQIASNDYYLKNRLREMANIGGRHQPNLEKIAVLKPDLILGIESNNRKNYELLSQIAPTVLAEGDWKEMLSQYAEALGKTDEAEQIMTDYHARIEEFQRQIGDDRLQKTEVSIVRVRQNQIRLYLKNSFCGRIVEDAGLSRPPDQATGTAFAVDISKELLHLADGDVIFVWTYGNNQEVAQDAQTALKQLTADPLWSKLKAVQQGKVYKVPSHWFGKGPIAADLVLDDLFEYLVPNSE